MKFTAVDMYLMDIGDAASTEYDFTDTSWINAFDENPDLMGLKIGQIHSHHSMGTFFSGTDNGHLHDQAPQHNYFLSLIVNFACEPIAKVAFASTRKIESFFSFKDDNGNQQYQSSNKEEEITVIFDCNIFVEIEPKLLDRIDELKKVKEDRYKKFTSSQFENRGNYLYTPHDSNYKSNLATVWDADYLNNQSKSLNLKENQSRFDFYDNPPKSHTAITDKEIEDFTVSLLANSYNDYNNKSVKELVEERNFSANSNIEARDCAASLHFMYDSTFNSETYFTEVMVRIIALLGKYKNDFTTKLISIIKKEIKEYGTAEL